MQTIFFAPAGVTTELLGLFLPVCLCLYLGIRQLEHQRLTTTSIIMIIVACLVDLSDDKVHRL